MTENKQNKQFKREMNKRLTTNVGDSQDEEE